MSKGFSATETHTLVYGFSYASPLNDIILPNIIRFAQSQTRLNLRRPLQEHTVRQPRDLSLVLLHDRTQDRDF